jgi:hypothetical protein
LESEQVLADAPDAATSLVSTVENFHPLMIGPGASSDPVRALPLQLFEVPRSEFDTAQVKIHSVSKMIRQARGIGNPARIGSYVKDTYHEIALHLVQNLDSELFLAVAAAGLLALELVEEVRKAGVEADQIPLAGNSGNHSAG